MVRREPVRNVVREELARWGARIERAGAELQAASLELLRDAHRRAIRALEAFERTGTETAGAAFRGAVRHLVERYHTLTQRGVRDSPTGAERPAPPQNL